MINTKACGLQFALHLYQDKRIDIGGGYFLGMEVGGEERENDEEESVHFDRINVCYKCLNLLDNIKSLKTTGNGYAKNLFCSSFLL